MSKPKRNPTRHKKYKGWVIEVSGRGPGRWDVCAGKDDAWYAVALVEGRVKDAFDLGREWIDERKGIRGVLKRVKDEPEPKRWWKRSPKWISNPGAVSKADARRYLTHYDAIDRANDLHELAEQVELISKRGYTQVVQDTLATRATQRAEALGHRHRCRRAEDPLACASDVVRATRGVQLDLLENPTTVTQIGDYVVTVFEQFDDDDRVVGYSAQAYDQDGPIGGIWYAESPEDALAIAVERIPQRSDRAPRRMPSPGDTALKSLKRRLMR